MLLSVTKLADIAVTAVLHNIAERGGRWNQNVSTDR